MEANKSDTLNYSLITAQVRRVVCPVVQISNNVISRESEELLFLRRGYECIIELETDMYRERRYALFHQLTAHGNDSLVNFTNLTNTEANKRMYLTKNIVGRTRTLAVTLRHFLYQGLVKRLIFIFNVFIFF